MTGHDSSSPADDEFGETATPTSSDSAPEAPAESTVGTGADVSTDIEPTSTDAAGVAVADPPHVAVVGGGAVGVTAAVDLAARGAETTLFDRAELGSGSSGRAAGVLYDAYAEDVDAALAARAMERFRDLDESLPGFEFTPCPYVIAVREGDEDAAAVPAMVDRMRAHGREVRVVEPDQLGERFPLATDDLAVAAVTEGAGWCDPAGYVAAMGERARLEGVDVNAGVEVELVAGGDSDTVEPAGSSDADESADGSGTAPVPELLVDGERREFDAVVVAVGAHTEAFFAAAGVPLPVKPYRVQALTSRTPYDGPMVYDATAGAYFRPHPTGLLAGDGTEPVEADPDDYEPEGDDWFVKEVSDVLRRRADHDPEVDRAWAGLCTATPDGDPLVGEVAPGVVVAGGWQGHGFMRAPAVGEHLAEGVLASLAGESPWIDAFDPGRFDGDETFEISEGMTVRSRNKSSSQ